MSYTHAELVSIARRWLLGTGGCGVAFAEYPSVEIPDALGFNYNGHTILIECKTSRADFRADAKKFFRVSPELGMGRQRYFLTTTGLIQPEELPEGWGLLTVGQAGYVRRIKPSAVFEARAEAAEVGMLYSALRRVTIHGFWHVVTLPFDAPRSTEPLFDPALAPASASAPQDGEEA